MAYNDISKNFTYENGGTIDGDLALTTMAANTKIKNKASGQLYAKRSGFTNVFDKTNTYANYLKADEFGINTSGSGNGVASITYSTSGRKITQNLTTFTTPSDLATANNNLKSQAVGSITVSGRTVTYKNVNGQTLGSFKTQDNNTTYSAGSGLSLNGTTFNVTSIAGNSNLQWNAEVTLGTVGGFAIKAKLPAIEEHGTGPNGMHGWIRFSGGLQFVWGAGRDNTPITFPRAFNGVPAVSATCGDSSQFSFGSFPCWSERSSTGATFRVWDASEGHWLTTGTFTYIAIGNWG